MFGVECEVVSMLGSRSGCRFSAFNTNPLIAEYVDSSVTSYAIPLFPTRGLR